MCPPNVGEVIVEFVTDRDTTHERPVDFGDQERRGHPTRRDATSAANAVAAADIGRPRLADPQVQQEVEPLSRKLRVSRSGSCLVGTA